MWRAQTDPVHLVRDPVFILCATRSGSTLLRSLLDRHSQICAPHELHLATMRVSTPRDYAVKAWEALGLSMHDLENMLWDRALHRVLVTSGKQIVVDKTPQNSAVWPRIHEFWPGARYVHLRRHPAGILDSLVAARPHVDRDTLVRTVLEYGAQLTSARAALPGPTVRYEDLTADPETALRGVCDYLGVRWEQRMTSYRPQGTRPGLGDWTPKIRSGRIQPHRPLPPPDAVPGELAALVAEWGY